MDDIVVEKSMPINYMRSPPAGRRQTYIVNQNGEEKKRDTKKWSFGGFFRRRKKSIESESSSQEDMNIVKGFMSRKKKAKKPAKPKKKLVGTFDHIVIHPKDYCMSDPSAGFNDYLRKEQNIFVNMVPKPNGSVETSKSSHESLTYGSLDSSTKKRNRERARQRRDRVYHTNESSSDEGSQRSTTSSLLRIKSDSDSGTKLSREGSFNRKTRSARTERYIKRLSREDENILNKEAEVVKSRQRPISTSPAKHVTSRKPPIFASNHENHRNDVYGKIIRNGSATPTEDTSALPLQRTTPDSYYMPKQKSWSFENHINRASPDNFNYYTPPHYPVARPYIINPPQPYVSTYPKNPPTPPPRDPQRRVITLSNDNFPRPMSYAFENKQIPATVAQKNALNNPNRTSSMRSINSVNYPPRIIDRRSNSDDQITWTPDPTVRLRPASVTPESTQKRYITRNRNPNDQVKYQFYTDQIPRSRKPIHIVQNDGHNQYLSDSQVEHHQRNGNRSPAMQSVTQFWKQKELEEAQRRHQQSKFNKLNRNESTSNNGSPAKLDQMESIRQTSPKVSSETTVPSPYDSLKRRDSNPFRPLSMVVEKPEVDKTKEPPIPPTRRSSRQNSASSVEMAEWLNEEKSIKVSESPIPAPRTSLQSPGPTAVSRLVPGGTRSPGLTAVARLAPGGNLTRPLAEPSVPKTRKSGNLEDALNELEEIYKSLHLGDEDLLDRAERRDVPTFSGKQPEYQDTNGFSSSNEDLPRLKRTSRRSGVPDRVTDDMAYRKLRKNDLSPSYSSPQESCLAQVSYLLASPDLTSEPPTTATDSPFNAKEPNVTLDDVVYRNLKHANNSLKVLEPQPPFGIPVGPVTAAPGSDYLHATPENRTRSRFIPQKIPDIVKDDLAFRSLRKDQVKSPLLLDDYRNNNSEMSVTQGDVRKKRAVRSLSANLYNMIQRERYEMPTSTETLTECGNNVASDSELNKNVQQRLRVYIPRGGNQESDTDIEITINKSSPRRPSAPQPELTDLNKSELETLLINLAKETQEESKKLEIELQKFEPSPKVRVQDIDNVSEHAKLCEKLLECVVESTDMISSRFTSDNEEADDRKIEELKKIDTLSNMLTDIDNVSEHAHICEELLECVVDSADLIIKPKSPVDSKTELENQNQAQVCGKLLESTFDSKASKAELKNKLKVIDDVSSQAQLCKELLESVLTMDSKVELENKLKAIDDVSSQAQLCGELLESVVDSSPPPLECIVQSSELIPIQPETVELPEDSLEEEISPKIATAAIELATNMDNETVELFENSPELEERTIANVILVRKPDSPSELMYIDSDRLSIVKSDDYENLEDLIASPTFSDGNDMDEEKSLFETEKQNIVENFTAINEDQNAADFSPMMSERNETQTKGATSACSLFAADATVQRHVVDNTEHDNTESSSSCCTAAAAANPPLLLWGNTDSKTIALACACALACTHQIATMDVITVLGIILAVISILFALIV